MPEKAVARMQQLGITQAVRNFDGVVMGASAGAMLQLGRYHVTPDEDYDSYGVYKRFGNGHVSRLGSALSRNGLAKAVQ